MPLLVAVSGFKSSGKTSLSRLLLSELISCGFSVAFLKHTDRSVLSPQKTDTGSVEELGITSVYWGEDGLRIEIPDAEFNRERIEHLFPETDIVIVEGGKSLPMPRIWLGSPDSLPDGVKGVFACFDRDSSCGDGKFIFAPGEEHLLVERIEAMYVRYARASSVQVFVKGKSVPLKPFVAEMVRGSVAGLLLPLKGTDSIREGVSVHLKRVK